jgi:2-methylcitrate dehydratase PrpD
VIFNRSIQFALFSSLAFVEARQRFESVYGSEIVDGPNVLALAKKVKTYKDSNAIKDQNYNTTMEVKIISGKSYRAFEGYPPGSPLNMVGLDVLRDKFRKLARAVLSEERIEKLIAAVERLDRSSDASELVSLVVA